MVGSGGGDGLGRTIMEFNLNLFKNSLMAHVAVVVEGGWLSDAGRKAVLHQGSGAGGEERGEGPAA